MPCTRWISVPATVVALAFTFTTLSVAQSTTAAPVGKTPSIANLPLGSSTAAPIITGSGGSLVAIDVVRPEIAKSKDLGRLPGSKALYGLQLELQRGATQQLELETFLAARLQPDSPEYGKMLTAAEFQEQFGLATSDISALKSWLESNGLTVGHVSGAQLSINYSGTVGQVEAAFHTEIHNYQMPDGRTFFANATPLKVPGAIAPAVRGSNGLSNFEIARLGNFDGPVSAPETTAPIKPIEASGSGYQPREGVFDSLSLSDARITSPDVANVPTRNPLAHTDLTSNPTATGVTVVPNTMAFASGATATVTATITYSGVGTPTGSVTFYDTSGYLNSQVLLTSCTAAAGSFTCTYPWTTASAEPVIDDTVGAVYSGDASFDSSSGTAAFTLTYPTGTGTPDYAGLTIASGTQPYGTSVTQTLTVYEGTIFVFEGTPTGNVVITGNGGIGLIDAIVPAASSCLGFGFFLCGFDETVTWHPSATLPPGTYTITAAYSGDKNFAPNYQTTTFIVTNPGTIPTTTTITAAPQYISTGAPGTTFTTTTSWTSAASPNQATGTLQLTGPAGTAGGGGLGSSTFPILGGVSTSGNGLYDLGVPYTYSYLCNYNAAGKNVVCAITDENVYNPTPGGVGTREAIKATYTGDANYAASNGTTATPAVTKVGSSPTTTVTTSLTPVTYGLGTAVTYTATVVGTRGDGQPTGTVAFSGTPLTGSPVTITITAAMCMHTGGGGGETYTCTVPSGAIVVPPLTPPAAYTVKATYSGSTTYGGAFGTVTETVIKQTPTLTAPTVTPNAVGQGSVGPVALSTTFAWAGTGNPPTNAVTFTVDGATVGTATCTTPVSDSETCTYSYNPSALATGGHTVRAVYAGDGHYNGVTSTGTTLTVNPLVTPTLALVVSPAGTTAAGIPSGTLVTLTATLTVPTNAGAWNGNVTFIDATSGVTLGSTNVGTGTGVTTTATFQFTPTSVNDTTYPAGFNQFTATYNGGTYYHSVGPVNGNPAYIGGLLFSLTLAHNFSTDPGTVDGTATTPYGIQVYNFTTAGVSSTLDFTNSNQNTNAFGYTTNCPVTIAAGGTCEIIFTYLPPYGDGDSTTVGRYEAGSWSVSAPGTILGVGIKGFASPPRAGVATFPAVLAGKALLPVGSLSVTPLSYTFGPLAPGAQSKTLQISVSNPNTTAVGVLYTLPTGSFNTVNNCPSTLNGKATCQIQVTFKSSTVGTQTASVTLNPAGGPAITVSLTGIVQAGTGLVMSTDNHGFGNIPLGQSGTQFGLNIKNNAATAATLSFSQSQGGTTPFNVGTGGCPASLAAGAQCSVIANFTPTAAGAVSDVLTVTSNQPIIPGGTGTGPYSAAVTFTGAGTTSATFNASTSTHNWGNIPVATTGSNYGVQLTNNTAAAITLTLGTGFANNKGFSLLGSNCGASLAVNASCELIFTFTPTATGTVTTTYGVSANGGAVQLYSLANAGYVTGITLIGTGVAQ
jgi:hypothetical protein